MKVAVRFLCRKGAKPPAYATVGSAGADLHACLGESRLTIYPGERVRVPTGLSIELPAGYEAQVRPRSGLAAEHGVTVLNAPGTIDSDYRGEIEVLLVNLGQQAFEIGDGQRIAQLVVAPVVQAEWLETDRLSDSQRGTGGFGHTGGFA